MPQSPLPENDKELESGIHGHPHQIQPLDTENPWIDNGDGTFTYKYKLEIIACPCGNICKIFDYVEDICLCSRRIK